MSGAMRERELIEMLADDVLASLDGRGMRPIELAVLAEEVRRLRAGAARESITHIGREVEAFAASVKRQEQWHEAIEKADDLVVKHLAARKKAEAQRDDQLAACREYLACTDKPGTFSMFEAIRNRIREAVARVTAETEGSPS